MKLRGVLAPIPTPFRDEAIDLDVLFEFEEDGYLVTPNAAATHAAMNR